MKISLCLAYAVLCALCSSFLQAQPKLTVVGGAGVDFGNIYYAKKVSHNFQILNSGTQTLTITEIKTFCSCTKAKISSFRPRSCGSDTPVGPRAVPCTGSRSSR